VKIANEIRLLEEKSKVTDRKIGQGMCNQLSMN
jgi:hypothetical protein